jgi:NAD(P)H-hydrate epimerase
MSRLSGRPISDFAANPVAQAREWATRWGVTLVLKGAPSVVAAPDGEVWVNPTGNSGLATGGSGDVLSGAIGALLGQGLSGPKAAVLGCYLHGLAADLAIEGIARRSLLPGDVAESLAGALRALEREALPPGWRWRRIL